MAATAWDSLLRSLQCKSQAVSDVYHTAPLKTLKLSHLPNSSCVQNLKDVVVLANPSSSSVVHHHHLDGSDCDNDGNISRNKERRKKKGNGGGHGEERGRRRVLVLEATSSNAGTGYEKLAQAVGRGPELTELPEGHTSRNIVEIIFRTGWAGGCASIERAFKVACPAETVARFEAYRELVRSRVGGSGRCVADGNEVLRFYSARIGCGLTRGRTCAGAGCAACAVLEQGFRGAAIRTAPSSRSAHEMRARSTGGRRGMLVCRVIAGRSMEERAGSTKGRTKTFAAASLPSSGTEGAVFGIPVGYDSVAGASGELVVFDPRALLPCFLVVYRAASPPLLRP